MRKKDEGSVVSDIIHKRIYMGCFIRSTQIRNIKQFKVTTRNMHIMGWIWYISITRSTTSTSALENKQTSILICHFIPNSRIRLKYLTPVSCCFLLPSLTFSFSPSLLSLSPLNIIKVIYRTFIKKIWNPISFCRRCFVQLSHIRLCKK